jgi:ubiquinone/menaquinone biosynthesis C-methylase UbiE
MERFSPGTEGEIWYEHWHRYHFVSGAVRGRRVLDIACGDGYGSALLAGHAAHVIGMDADAQVVVSARNRYGSAANLEYREGRCEAIPLPDASVDVVISLETLEHTAAPEKLVEEAARVLAAGGLFIVSTPNKKIYSDARNYRNPHHVREFYRDEFEALVGRHFAAFALFGQRVDAYSAIWPLDAPASAGQLLDARNREANAPSQGIADPMYYLGACAREPQTLEACRGLLSVLSDRDHYILNDYAAVQRRMAELQTQLERTEAAYVASQKQVATLSSELARRAAPAEDPAPPPQWRRR